jgi:hypothetical protein
MSNRNRMLSRVEEGMKVYDNQGSEVGTVEFVHFAEASGMSGAGAASTPSEPAESGLMDILGKVFGSDDLPEELRERLLMHGFIKMDSARLFGADRYIMFDQISKVEEDGVHLKVADSEALLKG